jgi:immune inhibitor A
MSQNAKTRFQDLFFSVGNVESGSVAEYYKEVSGGIISFSGTVVGPLLMPNPITHYTNGSSGLGARPNVQDMAADAVSVSEGTLPFSDFDNDGDGVVDTFVVVHAGTGAEESGHKDDIWSCQAWLPTVKTVDGVQVSSFLTLPEDALLGVCCHELGHLVFGWPDLYDTDYTSRGIGKWCLMSSGSWGGFPHGTKPCHPSAWCKAEQGWIEVENQVSNSKITCEDVKSGKKIHRLWKNGDLSSAEYFLCENRQLTGYDASLPGGGLLGNFID